MIDSRACWASGLWCGVAQRLIRERLARGPLTDRQRRAIASSIEEASRGQEHLTEPAAEALALLKE